MAGFVVKAKGHILCEYVILSDTYSTGGLISSGRVSKKCKTSSLCEIWGGRRTNAWWTHTNKDNDYQTQNITTTNQKHTDKGLLYVPKEIN